MALLEDIIKLASKKMTDEDEDEHEHEVEVEREQEHDVEHEDESEEEDDQTRETSPSPVVFEKNLSEIYSSTNSSLSSSPTSVLPEIITNASKKNAKASITSPLLLSLKVQAAGDQKPIELKNFSFHMIPHSNQDSSYAVQLGSNVDEKGSNTEANQECEIMDLPEIILNSLEKASENGGIFWNGASDGQAVPARFTFEILLPPSSISRLQSNVTEQASVPPSPQILSPKIIEPQVPSPPQRDSSCENEEPAPSTPPAHITPVNTVTTPPPPPPPPITSKKRAVPCPPPPPPSKSENVHTPPPSPRSPHNGLKGMVTPHPLPPKASTGVVPPPPPPKPMGKVAAPPPPPMPMGKRASHPKSPRMAVPAPPPPMQMKKGGAPPPPPPTFAGAKTSRPKKSTTKLKRSSQMGNLYRSLKGKVEGSSSDGKQKGGKGKFNASKGGTPAMADALAEMTKR